MVMTIGGSVMSAFLFIVSAAAGKKWLRNFVFGGVTVWFVFYFLMLVGFSIASEEKQLALNEPKRFCGFYLDCHMHAAVTDLKKTKTIGNKTANGEFYIATVKVSSDARAAVLGLITVDAHVVDDAGRTYDRDAGAEAMLPQQPDFEKPISPMESFEKEIAFDLPAGIQNPRLDLREGYGIDHAIEAVLIDDEDSVLHARSYFTLDGKTQTALR